MRGPTRSRATSEDGLFPEAGAREYASMDVKQRKAIGRVRFTMESIRDTMSNRGSFVAAQKSEMNGVIKDMSRYEEVCLNTDGQRRLGKD